MLKKRLHLLGLAWKTQIYLHGSVIQIQTTTRFAASAVDIIHSGAINFALGYHCYSLGHAVEIGFTLRSVGPILQSPTMHGASI